jgi:hypothetical protein
MCCGQGTLCFEIVKAMPTTAVAFAVLFVSIAQFRLAKAKLKEDLFDRRHAIFQKLWGILSQTAQKGARESAQPGLFTPFNNIAPEAKFLFGAEIEKYISDAATKWVTLKALEGEALGPGNAERIAALMTWFFDEASVGVKKLFDPYLSFEKWK